MFFVFNYSSELGLWKEIEKRKLTEKMASDKVMSVELAIQRELQYRRKMEALQFQLQGDWDSERPAVLSQEPSICVPQLKRKAPASPPAQPQPSCSRRPFRNRPLSLVCKACQESFSSLFYLKKHCEVQKHLLRVKFSNVSNPLWCELCQIGVSSGPTLEQHLVGKRHAASVQAMGNGKTAREEEAEVANTRWKENGSEW